MDTTALIHCLEKFGTLDRCEELALRAGWTPYEKPSLQSYSPIRVHQNVRLSWVVDGAGCTDLVSAVSACEPQIPKDFELLSNLSKDAIEAGVEWHAVPTDVASILVLSRASDFDSRMFHTFFSSKLMKILCSSLNLDWEVCDDVDTEELNG